jgi:integrase/recombinase XerD
LKSFLHYAASRDLSALPVLQRSVSIPAKRRDKPILGFLSRNEMDALLAVCDRSTWSGERDYVLLSVAYNTGARVSELVGLNIGDVDLTRAMAVSILGKGRKLRQVPLWRNTITLLKSWLKRLQKTAGDPVFPNRWNERLTRSGVAKRISAQIQQMGREGMTIMPSSALSSLCRVPDYAELSGGYMGISRWTSCEAASTTRHNQSPFRNARRRSPG